MQDFKTRVSEGDRVEYRLDVEGEFAEWQYGTVSYASPNGRSLLISPDCSFPSDPGICSDLNGHAIFPVSDAGDGFRNRITGGVVEVRRLEEDPEPAVGQCNVCGKTWDTKQLDVCERCGQRFGVCCETNTPGVCENCWTCEDEEELEDEGDIEDEEELDHPEAASADYGAEPPNAAQTQDLTEALRKSLEALRMPAE